MASQGRAQYSVKSHEDENLFNQHLIHARMLEINVTFFKSILEMEEKKCLTDVALLVLQKTGRQAADFFLLWIHKEFDSSAAVRVLCTVMICHSACLSDPLIILCRCSIDFVMLYSVSKDVTVQAIVFLFVKMIFWNYFHFKNSVQ